MPCGQRGEPVGARLAQPFGNPKASLPSHLSCSVGLACHLQYGGIWVCLFVCLAPRCLIGPGAEVVLHASYCSPCLLARVDRNWLIWINLDKWRWDEDSWSDVLWLERLSAGTGPGNALI